VTRGTAAVIDGVDELTVDVAEPLHSYHSNHSNNNHFECSESTNPIDLDLED